MTAFFWRQPLARAIFVSLHVPWKIDWSLPKLRIASGKYCSVKCMGQCCHSQFPINSAANDDFCQSRLFPFQSEAVRIGCLDIDFDECAGSSSKLDQWNPPLRRSYHRCSASCRHWFNGCNFAYFIPSPFTMQSWLKRDRTQLSSVQALGVPDRIIVAR